MSFVSISFIIFLLIIILCYYIVPVRFQYLILLLGSICFYFIFSIQAFAFLLGSTVIAFAGAIYLARAPKEWLRRCTVAFVIGLNIFLLIGLKYFSFWTDKSSFVVPLGISFYTLSLVGYMIDISRNKYDPEKNFLYFLLYTSYFPHILQGPIARYDKLGKQFKLYHSFDYVRVTRGCQLMIWGYLKKMVIADRAAVFVDAVYGQVATGSGTLFLVASLFYTVQIYADFSGCVDIALGVSEIFGIKLTDNFEQPYLAVSIQDFWRRWHISLSSWFRDYLYIPLGGNRKGTVRRWLHVLIVFGVSGFWHGVGINYIIWGLLHGIYQAVGNLFMPVRRCVAKILHTEKETTGIRAVHIMGTCLLVNFAWIFFRVTDLSQAVTIIRMIFTDFSPWILTDGTLYTFGLSEKSMHLLILMTGILFFVDVLHERGISIRQQISRECLFIRWVLYLGAVYAILLFGIYGIGYDSSSFIYMNF